MRLTFFSLAVSPRSQIELRIPIYCDRILSKKPCVKKGVSQRYSASLSLFV